MECIWAHVEAIRNPHSGYGFIWDPSGVCKEWNGSRSKMKCKLRRGPDGISNDSILNSRGPTGNACGSRRAHMEILQNVYGEKWMPFWNPYGMCLVS
eukprot:10750957-Karenia_brevis.AAC.1